jgi:hypothetical protein
MFPRLLPPPLCRLEGKNFAPKVHDVFSYIGKKKNMYKRRKKKEKMCKSHIKKRNRKTNTE